VIVDSSALIAILRDQPDAKVYAQALALAPTVRISAATWLEAAVVLDGSRDVIVSRRFDDLITEIGLTIEPFTANQARLAREAYRDFGKGSGHPAGLTLGDCFAYALARETGEPLLYKGDDFAYTDIAPARRPNGAEPPVD
jgi:ribonuclease VapC